MGAEIYYGVPGIIGAALVLAILGVVARYVSPGPTKSALLILTAAAFVYGLGDGLARLTAAGGLREPAIAWNNVRFFGIAVVPAALLHLAAAYVKVIDRAWMKPALALVYTLAFVFILLRAGTELIVETPVVGDGTISVTVGPAFAAFAAFGLACSLCALYLFAQSARTRPSALERANARMGAVAAVLPFGASIVYFALFRQSSSPTFDPIVPFLTATVILFAASLFSHEVPAATLAAIRAIFVTLPDGLVVVDRRGIVTFANAAADSMIAHTNPGLEGERFLPSLEGAALPDEVKARLKEAFRQVSVGESDRVSVAFETAKPPPRALRAILAAAEVGGLSRYVGSAFKSRDRFVFLSLHDETEARSREILLSRANEVKDLFISMIGHDLKAPINAITGYTELIGLDAQSAPDALAVYRYSQSILASARQIQMMMENARLFSRLVDPQDILRARETLDVAAIVEREAANLKGAADRRGVRVELAVEPGAQNARVVAAPIIRSVFQNLLDNAIKYTPERSNVKVTVRADRQAVEVDVEDEGPGIPADKREAVFRRFTRLEQTRTKTEGLGLGLSISKQVVELHEGTLSVGERAGGAAGARFLVWLPRAAEPAAPRRASPRQQ